MKADVDRELAAARRELRRLQEQRDAERRAGTEPPQTKHAEPATDRRCRGRCTDGSPCKNRPVRGGTVCWKHGGNAPQVRAAANRRLVEQRVRAAVVTYGLPRDIDPADALLEEVCRTAGHVAYLELQVRLLSPDEIVWGRAEEVEKGASEFPGTDTTQKAAPNVWVVLYRDERKHLVDVCTAALKAGVEERRVRLAERQGALIADVIRRMLEDPELGLNRRQQEMGRVVASRHLRMLTVATEAV